MLQLARGIIKTVKAIKSIDPEAMMFHVEATGMTRTARKDLEILAREEKHRGYICLRPDTGTHVDETSAFLVARAKRRLARRSRRDHRQRSSSTCSE